MMYIIADYDEYGLKVPRIVEFAQAQSLYEQRCKEEGLTPADLSKIQYPITFCDKNWEDYLWILEAE